MAYTWGPNEILLKYHPIWLVVGYYTKLFKICIYPAADKNAK